jgi:uncharacterized protein
VALPPPTGNATALVTGASEGIGEAIARELSHRGYHVVIVARRADRLAEVAAALGNKAHPLPADLSSREDRAALPERVAALGLVPDILVNNAGVVTAGPVAAADPDAELNLIDVDVAAVVDLCTRFVPGMVERRRGVVLNVASVGAFGPVPGQASYGAAKAFVLSYTHSLREELRPTGVTAAALCPGPVYTDISVKAGVSKQESEASLPKVLWRTTDDVALAAVAGLDDGRAVIIPGVANRAASAFFHLSPRRMVASLIARSTPVLKRD